MFYVLVVNEEAMPGRMVGPVEWDAGIELVRKWAETELKRDLIDEELDALEMDGCHSFSDGGGIYIVCCEPPEGE